MANGVVPSDAKTRPDAASDEDLESTFDQKSRQPASASPRFPEHPRFQAASHLDAAGRPGAPLPFEQRYALGEELARGAMGRVMAATDLPIGREVAIKLMLGLPSERAMSRFERESRMTARLQHPGIIPVYEVGRTAAGDPYIVMRLVHGQPLSDRIAAAASLAERLRLLPHALAAIDALAYAHGKEIIHRDLKPHNVLIGEFGETVVIDWGLAKDLRSGEASVEASDTGETSPLAQTGNALTQDGAVIGTPAYMSPEQASGQPADKRSDVYSLGAMLYHLLCGALPFQSSSVHETLIKVISGDLQPLEEREPALPTDLISIVRCAMSRDPDRRFPSAAAMAEELRRFLSGQLVSAHRYSTGELAARWLRKNRLAVAVAALALLALAGVGAVSVRRIVAEREQANRAAATAQREADFLTSIFKDSSPSETRGNTITARELLDRAAAQIDSRLEEDPSVQANLMVVMGQVYEDLGLSQQAEALYRKAVATDLRALGPHHLQTLSATNDLAILLYESGRFPEAEKLMRELVDERMRTLGPDDRKTLGAQGNLANLLLDTGRHDEGLKMVEDGLARRLRVFGPDDPDTVTAQSNLAAVYGEDDRPDLALPLARQTVAKKEKHPGPDPPAVLELLNGVAGLYMDDGDLPEAEAVATRVLEARKRVLGPTHPATYISEVTVGSIYWHQHRFAEAEKLLREASAGLVETAGADHPDSMLAKSRLAALLDSEGKLPEAIALTQELVERRQRVFGPEDRQSLRAVGNLGVLYMAAGRFAEAEAPLISANQGMLKAFGPNDADTADTSMRLGLFRLSRGDDAGALKLLNQALPALDHWGLADLPEEKLLLSHANDPRFAALLAGAKARADKLEADRVARMKL